jgi:hypothetical protein
VRPAQNLAHPAPVRIVDVDLCKAVPARHWPLRPSPPRLCGSDWSGRMYLCASSGGDACHVELGLAALVVVVPGVHCAPHRRVDRLAERAGLRMPCGGAEQAASVHSTCEGFMCDQSYLTGQALGVVVRRCLGDLRIRGAFLVDGEPPLALTV